jgi:sensor histidine kinase YesM
VLQLWVDWKLKIDMSKLYHLLKTNIVTVIVWFFFAVHLGELITGMSSLNCWQVFLVTTPPMIFQIFMVFSINYVVMGTSHGVSKYKFGLKIFFTVLIAQILFMTMFFFSAHILDASFGTTQWNDEIFRIRRIIGGMGWLYSIMIMMRSFLLHNIKRVKDAERRASEKTVSAVKAELKTIKSTIHPHFFFNSLNVIGALTMKEPSKAREICFNLSDFMRYSLRLGEKDFATVEEELEHIDNYLAIEKIRFGKKLIYEVHVPESLMNYKIPALLLLPILENSVKHGIQSITKVGKITLKIGLIDDCIVVQVTNPYEDGAKRLKGEGMGLKTLKKEISILYGDKGQLHVKKKQKWFKVKIVIPASQ